MNVLCVILTIIEYLYYFSGIFVGIGVIYAIRQYHLSKSDVDKKYSREIIAITSDLLSSFYKDIIPKYEKLIAITSGNFFLEKEVIIVKITDEKTLDSCKQYCQTITGPDIVNRFNEIALEVQMFAIGLSYGNADGKMAEKAINTKYVAIFESILPFVLTNENVDIYKESIRLFNTWRVNIKKMEAENKKAEAEKNTKELEMASKEINPNTFIK
ncbi:hypothetical protein AGMMS50225_24230 [Betaproteobacteria bacterium]|nr:hypothetical protein AGMMS50225_24230 [Betaproteobacteria bacterium]